MRAASSPVAAHSGRVDLHDAVRIRLTASHAVTVDLTSKQQCTGEALDGQSQPSEMAELQAVRHAYRKFASLESVVDEHPTSAVAMAIAVRSVITFEVAANGSCSVSIREVTGRDRMDRGQAQDWIGRMHALFNAEIAKRMDV